MTEYQIECRVEARTDSLDRRFMRGELSQVQYDTEIRILSKWAEYHYRALPRDGMGNLLSGSADRCA